MVAKPNKRA